MPSINPTAASVSAIRPFAGAASPRGKFVPQEITQDKTTTPGAPVQGRTGSAQIGEAARIGGVGQDTKAEGTKPNSVGVDDVSEPVDTSGISSRTDAVLEHTLSVLMNSGVKDADTLASVLGGIIEPLVAQDGVANPKAAAMQYIQEMIDKAQADTDSGTDSVGLRASGLGKSGLDLEG